MTQMTLTPPTRLLYHQDSYLKTFEARVVAVEDSALALDQTAIYPGGGGQLADHGTLTWQGHALPIASMRKAGEVIWHTIAPESGELPPV
ncbi:MAG TPA: alanine--tRNA ligase-related protein, partial [Ktedonobacterales bacterium]